MAITIAELKNKMATIKSQMHDIVTRDGEMDAEDTTRFDALEAEFSKLSDRVAKIEAVNGMSADEAEPVDEDKTFVAPNPKIEKGLQAGRYLIGLHNAKSMGPRAAAELVSRTYGDDVVAKALLASGSGSVIPTAFSTEIIELLRSAV